jgi:hypothetical protein
VLNFKLPNSATPGPGPVKTAEIGRQRSTVRSNQPNSLLSSLNLNRRVNRVNCILLVLRVR